MCGFIWTPAPTLNPRCFGISSLALAVFPISYRSSEKKKQAAWWSFLTPQQRAASNAADVSVVFPQIRRKQSAIYLTSFHILFAFTRLVVSGGWGGLRRGGQRGWRSSEEGRSGGEKLCVFPARRLLKRSFLGCTRFCLKKGWASDEKLNANQGNLETCRFQRKEFNLGDIHNLSPCLLDAQRRLIFFCCVREILFTRGFEAHWSTVLQRTDHRGPLHFLSKSEEDIINKSTIFCVYCEALKNQTDERGLSPSFMENEDFHSYMCCQNPRPRYLVVCIVLFFLGSNPLETWQPPIISCLYQTLKFQHDFDRESRHLSLDTGVFKERKAQLLKSKWGGGRWNCEHK